MSKIEETESSPLIFSEANKLVETLESSEDKIFQLKSLFEQKQNYLEQLDQHDNGEHKSIARKRADLSVLNNRVNMADMQNTKFRDGAKKAYDSCQEAYQYINDIESDFAECEDKFESFGNKLKKDTHQYEKQIDDLIRLLDQLTEKRSTKLEFLKTQENRFLDENLDLEKHIFDFEKQEESFLNDDADSELEMLENELKELQTKLSILDDDHCRLNNEEKDCESAEEELTQKYPESALVELEKRFSKVNNEVLRTIENLETQKCTESELPKSALTLEEYEAKLNKEIEETEKFWNDLSQSPYEGFSKIEQEIAEIKADILDRNEKYKEVKNSDEMCNEKINQKNEEIGATRSKVDQLSSELKEMGNVLNNLKTSQYFSEQYDIMTKDINELCKEKEKLNGISGKTENEIQETVMKLKKEVEKGDLELVALENNNLMEVRKFEKDCAKVEDAKTTLEKKAQFVENELKELEKLKNQDDKEALNATQKKELDVAFETAETSMKLVKSQREELMTKLGNVTAPPPIYVKTNDQNFAKPKINVFKKKIPHQQSAAAAAAKRNWDSDSSMEAEELKMDAYLKKKYRKRPAAENKKKIQNEA